MIPTTYDKEEAMMALEEYINILVESFTSQQQAYNDMKNLFERWNIEITQAQFGYFTSQVDPTDWSSVQAAFAQVEVTDPSMVLEIMERMFVYITCTPFFIKPYDVVVEIWNTRDFEVDVTPEIYHFIAYKFIDAPGDEGLQSELMGLMQMSDVDKFQQILMAA